MLNRLKGQASDLELLLDQLNSLEASLDDTLLAPPPKDDPGDLAARKAKRAAKRAERRAKATTAAVSGGAEAQTEAQVFTPPPSHRTAAGPASTSGRSIVESLKAGATSMPSAPSAASAAASNVLQLEELFKLTVGEPELPGAQAQPAVATAAAPSVLKPRKASKRVPATSPAAPPAPEPAAPAAPAPAPAVQPEAPVPAPQAAAAPTPSAASAAAPRLQPSIPLPNPTRRVAPRPAAAAAPAAPAAPTATPTPAPATESISQSLDRLLGGRSSPHTDDADIDLNSYGGPSDEDLIALEREVASLAAHLEDSDGEDDGTMLAGSGAAGALEASALVARAPAQVSVMPAGPSLLSLVPATAAQGRSARSRQARRSARYAHSGAARSGAAGLEDDGPRGKAAGRDGTNQFLHRSAAVNVLNQDMEREVTEVCRDFLLLEKLKRQCAKTLKREPSTEELAAALGMDVTSYRQRYNAGLRAKELLLKSNYRLVMAVCKKFIGKGMQVQDLVSEGVKGLMRAVEGYNAAKGFRFGTYAHWWIRQAVSRSMAETGRAVRLPNHTIEQLTKLRAASAKLTNALNREPSLPELAAAVGLPVERVRVLLEASRAAASIDTPVPGQDESGTSVKDTVQDDGPSADEAFGSSSMRDDIDSMLALLPEREAEVLRLRFGLEDGVEWTLEHIGDRLGVTRERIRQVEAKAMRKLQLLTENRRGKLTAYGENIDMLESKELAARNSNGTRKT